MKSRIIAVTATAVALITLLAACSGSSGNASSLKKQDPDVLTIALVTSPPTLDPALSGGGDPLSIYPELAYSPLITMTPDGSYGPGLATSWKYLGTDNTKFSLTLRSGVTFSDGGKLTADGVKKHFEYVAKAGGPFASRAAGYTIDVTGPLSLTISLATPDPDMEYELSQRAVTGDVISPLALADPAKMGTSTAGAGQYVFDSANSVTGQTYTYVPNTKYWDQKAINWKKIVIKVIPDANATLSALKSGSVDYTIGTPQNAAAAKKAGFSLTTASTNFNQIQIFDRGGSTVKALGNLKVRQAISYAIDRKAIAAGLYGAYGSPTSLSAVPGTDSYSKSLVDTYTYDPAKAKKLLAEAGYPNGFTFPLTAFNLQPGETDAAQAIAADLKKVGIIADITVPASINDFATTIESDPAVMFFYGTNPFHTSGAEWFYGYANPNKVNDATIDDLYQQAAKESDASKRAGIYAELQKRMQQLAWMVPFAEQDKIVISRPGLAGVTLGNNYFDPNPIFFSAK